MLSSSATSLFRRSRRTIGPSITQTARALSTQQTLPSEADVVVLGGGAAGASTVYHLAHMGVNAVLIERDELTSGTTWHSAGLLWRLRPNDTDIELINYTRDLVLNTLEPETNLDPGWVANGGLFIAKTQERLNEYRQMHIAGKHYGVESHILSPEEAKKVHPLMNVDDMVGALYSPLDGTIDPSGIVSCYVKGAKQKGAKIITHCPVTNILHANGEVEGVETTLGTIKTKNVVNAGGVWGRRMGKMAGVNVPLVCMRHAYVVTEKVEGIQGLPNIRDHDLSVYLKLQGDALAIGGYEQDPIFWDDIPDDFSFGLTDLDWEVFGAHIEGHIQRVPSIEQSGIKSTVCGPESFTADHKPLIGPAPELKGYWLNCGYNSAGIMLSGGCGREMARWIANGHTDLDMFGYDIRRFHNSFTDNDRWINERSHESYAKNYAIVWHHDQPMAGRNMRKDPLHSDMLAAGCVFQEMLGWERPGWFAGGKDTTVRDYDYYGYYGHDKNEPYPYKELVACDYTYDHEANWEAIGREALTCRNKVAVFNQSAFGKFVCKGPDAQKAMEWISTNRMDRGIGRTVYTNMCNKNGGTECDLTVSHVAEDEFYIAAGGAAAQHDFHWIESVIRDEGFNCTLEDVSDDHAVLTVMGRHSRDLLQSLTDADLSHKAFPFSTNQLIRVAGEELRALRLTYVGELGWELHIPNKSAKPVYDAIMQAGEQYGIVNAGYRAIDCLSMEKGYRHWHADIRTDDTPIEAGNKFVCKMKSGIPFLGREALEQQIERGVSKRILAFTAPPDFPVHPLNAVFRDDQCLGYVRRPAFGYSINKNIAHAVVYHPDGQPLTDEWLKEGKWRIETVNGDLDAELQLGPFFDPKNDRVKGNYENVPELQFPPHP